LGFGVWGLGLGGGVHLARRVLGVEHGHGLGAQLLPPP